MQSSEAVAKNQAMFDREYSGYPVTLAASAARDADVNLTAVDLLSFRKAHFLLDVTALASAADDHADIYIDISPDGGTTWVNAIHFPQLDGNGSAAKHVATLCAEDPGTSTLDVTSDAAEGVVRPTISGNKARVRVDITNGAGTHSFTFSVTALLQ